MTSSREVTVPVLPELERSCDACQGNGVIQDPAWAAWWDRHKTARDTFEAANPGRNWYGTPGEQRLDADLPDSASEEIECGRCRGSGTVPTEAGQQLLSFLRNHWRC